MSEVPAMSPRPAPRQLPTLSNVAVSPIGKSERSARVIQERNPHSEPEAIHSCSMLQSLPTTAAGYATNLFSPPVSADSFAINSSVVAQEMIVESTSVNLRS